MEATRLEDFEIERFKKGLSKALVLLNMLGPVRSKFNYGVKNIKKHKSLAGVKEIFDYDFKEIATQVVNLTSQIYWQTFYQMNQKIKTK